MNIMTIPAPIGTPATVDEAQWMLGFEVHANQKRPVGRRKDPITRNYQSFIHVEKQEAVLIGGSRSSGITRPCSMNFFLNLVFVMYAVVLQPAKTPIVIPKNGKAPNPSVHPRPSWKLIG